MPRATVNTAPERFELKTLPEGYVELKRMPYAQWLTRQEMAMRMEIEGGKKGQGMKGEMKFANTLVTQFEFKHCIVDHNLEDDNGNKLDFNFPVALQQLDPRIGNEIGELIQQMHEVDEGN